VYVGQDTRGSYFEKAANELQTHGREPLALQDAAPPGARQVTLPAKRVTEAEAAASQRRSGRSFGPAVPRDTSEAASTHEPPELQSRDGKRSRTLSDAAKRAQARLAPARTARQARPGCATSPMAL
jgi:hypothetical protein